MLPVYAAHGAYFVGCSSGFVGSPPALAANLRFKAAAGLCRFLAGEVGADYFCCLATSALAQPYSLPSVIHEGKPDNSKQPDLQASQILNAWSHRHYSLEEQDRRAIT